MVFPCVKSTNTKIQIHKYTNTAYDKVTERHNMWYISKRGLFKGIKIILPCVKRANTQIQIHKYTNTQIHIQLCIIIYYI